MATSQNHRGLFANYPLARAGPQVDESHNKPRADKNPALRGIPLAIAASV